MCYALCLPCVIATLFLCVANRVNMLYVVILCNLRYANLYVILCVVVRCLVCVLCVMLCVMCVLSVLYGC